MVGSLVVGDGDEFSFEDMRPGEQAIMMALEQAHAMGFDMLHISDLQAVNGWEGPAGNSKVRNNLRRLMKHGLICRTLDGTYALKKEPKKTAPQVEAVPAAPAVKGNPRELNGDEVSLLRRLEEGSSAMKVIESIKKADCTIYNACLSQAISGKWAGFSCASCTAYSAPNQFQRESDLLALRALGTAAEMLEEYGKVNRIRGVKPGADAKRTVINRDAA